MKQRLLVCAAILFLASGTVVQAAKILNTQTISTAVTDSTAVITWQTSSPSLTWLTYGTSLQFGTVIKLDAYGTEHRLALKDLSPGTTFYFHIFTEDFGGFVAPDDTASLYSTFTTLTTLDVAALEKRLNELRAQLALLQSAGAAPAITPPNGANLPAALSGGVLLTRTLTQGDAGEDVKRLQIFLNSDPRTRISESGVGSPGKETMLFGARTKAAVIRFQELYPADILTPFNLQNGTGVVGRATRTKIQVISAAETTGPTGVAVAIPGGRADEIARAEGVFQGGGGGGSSSGSGAASPLAPTAASVSGESSGSAGPAASASGASTSGSGAGSSPTTAATTITPTPTPPVSATIVPTAALYGPIATAPLAAVHYHVSPTGAGRHDGSLSHPFSLAEAQSFANTPAQINNTIVFSLAPGEYGSFSERTSRGDGAWVTYQAADLHNKPVFRGTQTSDAIYIRNAPRAMLIFTGIAAYNSREVTFEVENANYVTLRDSYIEGPIVRAVVGYAVRAYNANNFTIQNSVIRGGTNGISTYMTDNLSVINNDFGGQLIDGGHFADMNGFSIIGNDFHDGSDPTGAYPDSHVDGVQFDAGPAGIKNGTFSRNRVANFNGQGFFLSRAGHLASSAIENITIAENLITGTYLASPFQIEGSQLVVVNNTVAPVSPIVSLLDESTFAASVRNNIFTNTFLNCGRSTTQDYNLIGTYITFGCNGNNVAVGSHDVVGTTVRLDAEYAPTLDQIYSDVRGFHVNGCTMSETGAYVGAKRCGSGTVSSGSTVASAPTTSSGGGGGWSSATTTTAPAAESTASTPASTPASTAAVLLGHWSFNAADIVDSIALDQSGNGRGGGLVGSPLPMPGRFGEAIRLFDSLDQNIRLDPFNSVLNQGASAYTISAWVYPTDLSALSGSHFGGGIIKSIGNSGNGTLGDFYLSITSAGEVVFTNWRGSGDQPGGRQYVNSSGGTMLTANAWYHVAATWDGTTNTIYINGVAQPVVSINTDVGYGAGTYIGALINGAASWQWTGGIDELKIYNRALTLSEMQLLYANTYAVDENYLRSFVAGVHDAFGVAAERITALLRELF
jgi:hypothetical protein